MNEVTSAGEPRDYVIVTLVLGAATGGGIGSRLLAIVDQLSKRNRVTLISTKANDELMSERYGDNENVRLVTLAMPQASEVNEFYGVHHLWSARVLAQLRKLYPDGAGPDLIEFSDYLGEAAVTVQAKQTGDPLLANTTIAVWLATTGEIVDVLNGCVPDDLERRAVYALERYSLAFADCLMHGPGDLYPAYQRFYGAENLAPPAEMQAYFSGMETSDAPSQSALGDPLKLLFLGRLEQRKGVFNLVTALAGSPLQNWRLTFMGGDTNTGPSGGAVQNMLEQMSAFDSRIEFRESPDRDGLPAVIDEHDAVISASIWEAGPIVGTEALARNRAFLATPVGGQVALAVEGRSGMLAAGSSERDLHDLVERAAASRDEIRELIAQRRPLEVFGELVRPQDFDAQFERCCAIPVRRMPTARRPGTEPTVSVVIPYFRLLKYLPEALASIQAQTFAVGETLIVNDGSFSATDDGLVAIAEEFDSRLLTKLNSGVGATRNFGINQTSGDYVMLLDPDNRMHPSFIERAVHAMEQDSSIAYVTSWLHCIDESGAPNRAPSLGPPIGNFPGLVNSHNCAGDAMALVRRSVFDAGHRYDALIDGFEDWEFYRELHRARLYGHVVPEPLLDYRIRQDSKLRSISEIDSVRLNAEMRANQRSAGMQWNKI